MSSTDLKECLKEVNVKRFGDRFKICERLRTVTGIISSEHHTVETENNLDDPVITEVENEGLELLESVTESEVLASPADSTGEVDITESSDVPDISVSEFTVDDVEVTCLVETITEVSEMAENSSVSEFTVVTDLVETITEVNVMAENSE